MKLALQPVGEISHHVSRRLAAEDFTAKVFMKWVGDRSVIDRQLFCDLSRKPLQLVGDQNQLWHAQKTGGD